MDLTIILAIYGSKPLCAANDHARIYRKLWQRPSTSRRGIQSYLPPFFLKLTNSVSSKLVDSIILSGNLRNWMIRYSHCKVNKIFWVFNYFAWWPTKDFGRGHHIFTVVTIQRIANSDYFCCQRWNNLVISKKIIAIIFAYVRKNRYLCICETAD